METTTLQQLEQLREETRALQRQNKALPAFLSITFIPIIVICGWVMFPEDERGIMFVGKIWIAGILIGLMVCGYLSIALGLSISFRTYWPSLTAGLVAIIPLVIATAIHATYGLPLVQWSVSLGVIACGLGQYYYLVKIGTNKNNFTAHFIHAFLALMILYSQLEAGIGIAQNFPTSVGGQIVVCLFYPFFSALFRRLCVLVVPSRGRVASEILSIYIASMTYRILTVYYYRNWTVFLVLLALEIFFKWMFYSCQLSDGYLVLKKKIVSSVSRLFSFPTRFQRYIHLEEAEESEEFIPIPLDKEREEHHKEISFYFFLQTHADFYFGIGMIFVQLTAMKLANHTETVNCISDFWADFISITIKYGIVALIQILNIIVFYFYATRFLKKETFSPVAQGTTSLSQYHLHILFSTTALYLFVFILFFHAYSGKSVYCPV